MKKTGLKSIFSGRGDKVPARTIKRPSAQKKRAKTPQKDMFTRMAEAILHVECVKELRFHDQRKWRFDYAIPEYKIALEVEGGVFTNGRHTRPGGFLGDMEKYNTATVMGWRVVRTTPKDLLADETFRMLKTMIENFPK